MTTYIRQTPYTPIGVKRLPCKHACGRKAITQAKIDECGDGKPGYFALCGECACDLADINRQFVGMPKLTTP